MQNKHYYLFHSAKELKKHFDLVETKLKNHSIILINNILVVGLIEIEGDKLIIYDHPDTKEIVFEINVLDIFVCQILTDDSPQEDFNDFKDCYEFVNYKLQFLDDNERTELGFKFLRDSDDDDEYLFTDELEKEIRNAVITKNSLSLPAGSKISKILTSGHVSQEEFLQLVLAYNLNKK